MTQSVVTNVADLSEQQCTLLLRPETPERMAQAKLSERASFRALLRRSLITDLGAYWYRLTELGVRARLSVCPPATVNVQHTLGNYGWMLAMEMDFTDHRMTTWTRGDHVLVLVFQGVSEVSAAILDGTPLDLDRVAEVITAEAATPTPAELLAMAAQRAKAVASPRFAFELAELLGEMSEEQLHLTDGFPQTPSAIRLAAGKLAAAILSAPYES